MVTRQMTAEMVQEDRGHLRGHHIEQPLQPVVLALRREMAGAGRGEIQHVLDAEGRDLHLEVEKVPAVRSSQEKPCVDRNPQEHDEPEGAQQAKSESSSSSLGPALGTLLHALGERTEHELASVIATALEKALSSAVCEAVELQTRHALTSLVDHAFEALPSSISSRELQEHTTTALQGVLEDMIESTFAGPIRAELTRHGERAIQCLFHHDLSGARVQLQQALEESLRTMVEILQPRWSQILRLVVPIIVKTLGSNMASKVKEGPKSVASSSHDEEKDTAKRDARKVRSRHPRRRDKSISTLFAQTSATLRQQVTAEAQNVNQRLKEGFQEAGKQSTRNQHLGHPPSRKGPGGTAGLGRPPSRRGPGGCHPSRR